MVEPPFSASDCVCTGCEGLPDLVIWVMREEGSLMEPGAFLCWTCYVSKSFDFLIGIKGRIYASWEE